jgi:hypothetical protein
VKATGRIATGDRAGVDLDVNVDPDVVLDGDVEVDRLVDLDLPRP